MYCIFYHICYPTDTTLHFNNDLCSRVLKHRATVCWRSSDCANNICTRFRISFACRFLPFILSKIFSRGLKIWRVTANTGLQSGRADNGWSPAWGLGVGLIMLHRERRQRVMTCDAGSRTSTYPLEWTGNRKMDMKSGPWKLKTLCRAGSWNTWISGCRWESNIKMDSREREFSWLGRVTRDWCQWPRYEP
jgi:hypothetical protein